MSIALREKGFTEFLPLYKSKRQWADRTKVVEMPLFPGYIFCSTSRSLIVPVLMTSGVIDVVRAGTNPLPADKAEIEALQQTVAADVPLEAWPYTEVGESGSFSILRGPLAGLTGILVEVRRSQRLILSSQFAAPVGFGRSTSRLGLTLCSSGCGADDGLAVSLRYLE